MTRITVSHQDVVSVESPPAALPDVGRIDDRPIPGDRNQGIEPVVDDLPSQRPVTSQRIPEGEPSETNLGSLSVTAIWRKRVTDTAEMPASL